MRANKTFAALGAACLSLAFVASVVAQDDLDDLLDLDNPPKPAAPAKPAEAPKPVEAPKPAEAPKPPAEVPKPAEAPMPAVEAPKPADKPKPAAEKPAEVKPTDSIDDLLDAPAPVAPEKPATPAPTKPAVVEEPSAPAPADKPKPAAEKPAEVKPTDSIDDLLDSPAPAAPEKPATPAPTKPAVVEDPSAPAPAVEQPAVDEPTPPAPAPAVAQPAVEDPTPPAPVAVKPAPVEPPKQVAQPKPEEPPHPEAELISDLVETERLRREALDLQADKEIDSARAALAVRDWDTMYKQYYLAYMHLNDRADSAEKRKECLKQMAEAKYQAAKQALRESDREGGLAYAKEALKLRHPNAAALIEALEAETTTDNETDISDIKHVRDDDKFKKDRDLVHRRLRLSSQYFAVGDLTSALDQCELVLRDDPYNRQAIALYERIQTKRQVILRKEREATRKGMIADVDESWRPVYAINSPELKAIESGTTKVKAGNDERSLEQSIEKRMKDMILPAISFRPPATIIDAVDHFRQASKDFDRPEIPVEQRGFNFVLQLDKPLTGGAEAKNAPAGGDNTFSTTSDDENAPAGDVPQIPNISASNISLWEALKLVCKVSNFKFKVQGSVVMVMPKSMTTEELVTRTYSVVESFTERVNEASSSLANQAAGTFNNDNGGGDAGGGGDVNDEASWKKFFEEMGVTWPQNSRIKYLKATGKLRVTNTEDQLAVLEDALNELNVTPSMIEIETRFVEVAQEDLNSLGFEWLLNSDYTFSVGGKLKKALNLKDGTPFDTSGWVLTNGQRQDKTSGNQSNSLTDNAAGAHTAFPDGRVLTGSSWSQTIQDSTTTTSDATQDYVWNSGAGWVRGNPETGGSRTGKNMLVNAIDGNTYNSGMRYLSTSGNHVSGDALSHNDKFMRLNAFLGNADLSVILHMLSQRSDTDLLSAPKVVTKSGQEAVIKVVTIYRYPQDYDVTIQSTGGGSSSGYYGSSSSNGKILPMVEPQNFETQEVGVILTVTPDLSPEGLINLALTPKIISEPEWRDYGMKVPLSAVMGDTNSPFRNMDISGTASELASLMTTVAQSNNSAEDIQWFSVPMEQPFFKERSIDTHVTLYNGATIVMGGLITEERRSMEDKIPFLGDIPFIGRIFRSRSEWSNKRNLLVFVTARLVDPNGRQIIQNVSEKDNRAAGEATVTPAPAAK